MCYVNYVRESTSFMRYACDQGLKANERLLWYALFEVMNARAKGCDWPEGLIPVQNKRLLSLVPFGEDSLIAARNKLKQLGLIDFRPGRKNAAPPMYQMNYFHPELSTNYPQSVDSYPEISGKTEGKTGGNIGGKTGGNDGGKAGGIILNYKYTQTSTERNSRSDEPSDTQQAAAAAADELVRLYRLPDTEQSREAILEDAARVGFERVEKALKEAALSNAKPMLSVNFYRAVLNGDGRPRTAASAESIMQRHNYGPDDYRRMVVDLDREDSGPKGKDGERMLRHSPSARKETYSAAVLNFDEA